MFFLYSSTFKSQYFYLKYNPRVFLDLKMYLLIKQDYEIMLILLIPYCIISPCFYPPMRMEIMKSHYMKAGRDRGKRQREEGEGH